LPAASTTNSTNSPVITRRDRDAHAQWRPSKSRFRARESSVRGSRCSCVHRPSGSVDACDLNGLRTEQCDPAARNEEARGSTSIPLHAPVERAVNLAAPVRRGHRQTSPAILALSAVRGQPAAGARQARQPLVVLGRPAGWVADRSASRDLLWRSTELIVGYPLAAGSNH
jgi:hypothetical protein